MPKNRIPRSEQLALAFEPAEEWRPVVGYEGYYEVSNLGRVRSVARTILNRGIPLYLRGKVLRLRHTGSQKYYRGVCLSRNASDAFVFVHRLVLESFVGLRPAGLECNHKDGNPSNNCLDNLEWVTADRNKEHQREIGHTTEGTKNGNAIYTTEDVLLIRNLYAQGYSVAALTSMIHGTKISIYRVVKRITYTRILARD